jgi:hypothetical protein
MAFAGGDLLFPQEPQRSAAGSRQESKKAGGTESTPEWGRCSFSRTTTFKPIHKWVKL